MNNVNNTPKPKKSLVKRILKWSGIGLGLLLILAIVLPLIFQKRIFQWVLDEANKNLLADVSIADYDLTFVSTFPNLTLELKEVKVSGRNEFQGVDLIDAQSIQAKLDLNTLFSDQIEIQSIQLSDANINVSVLRDGKANYDITIPDSVQVEETEPSKFALALDSYELTNVNIVYNDDQGGTRAVLSGLNHKGAGDLTQDVVDFKTTTDIASTTVFSGGVPMLVNVKTNAVFNFLMESKPEVFKMTFKENELKLNDFSTAYTGWVSMTEEDMDFDIRLDASKATFASFISLIPSVYQTGYESMITKGSFAMNGYLKGKLSETIYPGFLFDLKVSNASFKYPDLSEGFKNIEIDMVAKRNEGANLDNTLIDFKRFNLDFLQNSIKSSMKLASVMTDPNIDANIFAKVDLSTLEKVMPMLPGESYQGKIDADVDLNGRMSAIEQERYEDFNAEGYMKMEGFTYASADFSKPINIKYAELNFSPKFLDLKQGDLKIGDSDLLLNGRVDNYMAYMFRDEMLEGNFSLNSNYMNLDELMGLSTYEEEESDTTSAVAEDAYALPTNLKVGLDSKIQKLEYDGMQFQNLSGRVALDESKASMTDVRMDAFGGIMEMAGTYETYNPKKPKVDMNFNMQNVDVKSLGEEFLTVEKLMPIVKFVDGRVNTKFNLNSEMNSNLDFLYESITGDGTFSLKTMSISGFEPLNKLSNELRMPQLSKQTLKDVAASFKIKDGKINLIPFNVNLDKIKVEQIQGWTSLSQNINYDMKMMIPKEMIPNEIVKKIEATLKKAGGVASKLNLNQLPAFIPVKVNVGGTVTKPTISTDMEESIKKLTGNIKDQVTNMVNDKVNQAKDSVTKIVNDKIDEVKDDLQERKQKLLDDAQIQANKVKAEAKKQADAVRAESNKQAERLINEAKNPLEKAAAERAARGVRDKGEKAAKKIEDEAQEKADKIMQEARERADKLK